MVNEIHINKMNDNVCLVSIKDKWSDISNWLKTELTNLISEHNLKYDWVSDSLRFGWHSYIYNDDGVDEFILKLKQGYAQYIEMDIIEGQVHHYTVEAMTQIGRDSTIARFFFEKHPELIKDFRVEGEKIRDGVTNTHHSRKLHHKQDGNIHYFTIVNTIKAIDTLDNANKKPLGTHTHKFTLKFGYGNPKEYNIGYRSILISMTALRHTYAELQEKYDETPISDTSIRMSISSQMNGIKETYQAYKHKTGIKTPLEV